MSPIKKGKSNGIDEIIPAVVVEPTVPDLVPPPLPPMPAYPPTPPGSTKPGKVQTIAILTLISGISNIIWMISAGIGIFAFGIGTFGVGCLLIPLVLPPNCIGCV